MKMTKSVLMMCLMGSFYCGSVQALESSDSVSTEQRSLMAEMHQKMAECLNSSSSIMDCKKSMMQNKMWNHQKMMSGHGMMGMDGENCEMQSPAPSEAKTK